LDLKHNVISNLLVQYILGSLFNRCLSRRINRIDLFHEIISVYLMASRDFLWLSIIELLSHCILGGWGTNNRLYVIWIHFLLVFVGVGKNRWASYIALEVISNHLLMIELGTFMRLCYFLLSHFRGLLETSLGDKLRNQFLYLIILILNLILVFILWLDIS